MKRSFLIMIIFLLNNYQVYGQTSSEISCKIDSLELLKYKIETLLKKINREISILKSVNPVLYSTPRNKTIPNLREKNKINLSASVGIIEITGPKEGSDLMKTGISGNLSIYGRVTKFFGIGSNFVYGYPKIDFDKVFELEGFDPNLENVHIKGGELFIFSVSPFLFYTVNPQSKIEFNFLIGYGYYREGATSLEVSTPGYKHTIISTGVHNSVGSIGSFIVIPVSNKLKSVLSFNYNFVATGEKPPRYLTAFLGLNFE